MLTVLEDFVQFLVDSRTVYEALEAAVQKPGLTTFVDTGSPAPPPTLGRNAAADPCSMKPRGTLPCGSIHSNSFPCFHLAVPFRACLRAAKHVWNGK